MVCQAAVKIQKRNAAIKIQKAFRNFRACKSYRISLKKRIKEQRAAIKIQSAYKRWKGRKSFIQQKKAAIIILMAFRIYNEKKKHAKETSKKVGNQKWNQFSFLFSKAKKILRGRESIQLINRVAGVNVPLTACALDNMNLSFKALVKGKFRISGAFAGLAFCQGFNAAYKLFLPREVNEMERIQRFNF